MFAMLALAGCSVFSGNQENGNSLETPSAPESNGNEPANSGRSLLIPPASLEVPGIPDESMVIAFWDPENEATSKLPSDSNAVAAEVFKESAASSNEAVALVQETCDDRRAGRSGTTWCCSAGDETNIGYIVDAIGGDDSQYDHKWFVFSSDAYDPETEVFAKTDIATVRDVLDQVLVGTMYERGGSKLLSSGCSDDGSTVKYVAYCASAVYGDWGLRDRHTLTRHTYIVDKNSGKASSTTTTIDEREGSDTHELVITD